MKRATAQTLLAIACGMFPLVGAAHGQAVKVNDPMVTGGNVDGFFGFQITPDSSRVVWRADAEQDDRVEVYSRAIDGSGTQVNLNDDLVPGGRVDSFRITPDSTWVVWRADAEQQFRLELYSRAIDGSGTQVNLNNDLRSGGEVLSFQITPDSTWVVWRADAEVNVQELFSRAIDGFGLQVNLNDDLLSGGHVRSFQITPDSSRVVWSADAEQQFREELYSRAIDGTGTQVNLNDDLVADGDVIDFQIAPDSGRVVWSADAEQDFRWELYSRAADASGPQVNLNDDLVTGAIGVFNNYQIAPDSVHVVWRADAEEVGRYELYSRRTDGSDLQENLNDDLGRDGGVHYFQISPDSGRVVWTADAEQAGRFELYSRAADGGSRQVNVNDDLVAGGDVGYFQITPDNGRVVWTANAEQAFRYELYSRPIDGSGTQVNLNDDLVAGDVIDFQITPDSSRVVWRADAEEYGRLELYSRATDGSGPQFKLNDSLVPGGEVDSFRISADSSVLVYLADQDIDETFEVYAVALRQEWASGTSGFWEDPAQWRHQLPIAEFTEVQIEPEGGAQVIGPSAPTTVYSLSLGSQVSGTAELFTQALGDLRIHRGLHVQSKGRLNVEGLVEVGGQILNHGQVDLASDAQLNGNALENRGRIYLAGGAQLNGETLDNHGLIAGSGNIDAPLTNFVSGDVRAGPGDRLRFTGVDQSHTNQGLIEAIGTPSEFAQIEFDSELINAADTGTITSHGLANLRFHDGLANLGSVGISFGTTNLFGDVANQGTIVVSGNSNVTLHDDLDNDGTIQVSDGSTLVLFGDHTGTGNVTGGGTVFEEGDLRPGDSPAQIGFGGDVVFGPAAGLEIELSGLAPGEYDAVNVAGTASLAGRVTVSEIDTFEALPGDQFTVLTYGSRAGEFDDVDTTTMPAGLLADLIYDDSLGEAVLAFDGLAGDANLDGYVNEMDLDILAMNWETTVTRGWKLGEFNDDGSIDIGDLTAMAGNWQTDIFGDSSPEPFHMPLFEAALARAAVPEPSTLALLACSAVVLPYVWRRRRRGIPV